MLVESAVPARQGYEQEGRGFEEAPVHTCAMSQLADPQADTHRESIGDRFETVPDAAVG